MKSENPDFNLINEFLFFLSAERGLAENTIISYRFDLEGFLEFLITAKKKLQEVIYFDVINYFEFLVKEKSLETASQLRKTSVFFGFFEFLIKEKGFSYNPIKEFERPHKNESLPVFLQTEEAEKLILTASKDKSRTGLRNYAIICLLYSSGMRISECLSIKLRTILDSKNQIKKSCIIEGKGGRERVVFINLQAKEAILNYIPTRDFFGNSEEGFLFNTDSKSNHLTRQSFFYSLKQISYKAGLSPESISPHKIRHSFATHMFLNGIDIRILQEMLGHADISTTQIYTHINSNSLKLTVENFHPFAKME